MEPLPESSARWEYRGRTAVDGVGDLAAVNYFEVDAGDAEVRVPELALDDDERNALAGHLDGVRVSQLMWSEAAGGHRRTGLDGAESRVRRWPTRVARLLARRPRKSRAPTGIATRTSSHRL